MTNKLEIDQELAERLVAKLYDEMPGNPDDEIDELRALLAAKPVDENAHLPHRVESLSDFLHRGTESNAALVVERQDRRDMAAEIHLMKREATPPFIQTLHANGDRIAMEATIAQQAETIERLREGIDKHWKVVCDQRTKIADLERGRGEPVYQSQYLGDGGGGWCDVEREVYELDSKRTEYRTRIVYAEQPAPVAVPEGWKLVPIEPTIEMLEAAAICYGSDEDCYKVMIANAPDFLDKVKELNQ